ncbi:cytochrome c biogenesis protein CcdA [Micromonospora sp. WMMD1102]|uniref:cytochrome c biogenesis CcdA family protein n=1 Tax=Micromonospora sp. WMMD1102 TaxID=3016105 RepID=UPI0024158E97|nr:cytochrome c biogenesis protein CcdA [Micromonospora sp. WMMD1102]MDG4789795.1 cytochrome c biogenesis protein CcdA [Micromonospora sp. WMMD1102]
MLDAPYALALAAGLLAAVNPCGFALLPAYLSFLVLADDDAGRSRAIGRALWSTLAMTTGFVAVFGAFGLLAAPVAGLLAQHLPWVGIVVGLALVGFGAWLLAGRELPSAVPKVGASPELTRRFGSMALFGASYAIASLGCTVGPFLAVVVAGFRTDSIGAGIGLFLAYAAGMALVVGLAALAVALAKVSLVRRLRRAAPVVGRVAGGLLVLAGGYVAWYGWYEIRVFRGAVDADPVVDTAATVQTTITGWLDSLGPGPIALGFTALLLAGTAAGTTLRVRRRARRES